MDKHNAVIQAVEALKASEFKTTAIKVELEAQLDRGICEGSHTCGECDGAWEGERCEMLCDSGYISCERCSGEGHIRLASGNLSSLNCRDCGGNGRSICDECNDEGYYSNCEYCDEGRTECWDCEQNWDNYTCLQYIINKLGGDDGNIDSDDCAYTHDALPTIPYMRFYNDGSVDSELTFTVSLDNPDNIFILPKVIEAFNDLAEDIGNGMDTRGAGMHMALIHTDDYSYPSNTSSADENRFYNFSKSMQLLLPALYFLASSDDKSRGLSYRQPCIQRNSHRSAIDYRNGAVEFRVFNTCYDNPEAILDNVVVMSNAMKYWRMKHKKNGLSKITNHCAFGVEGSDKLDRFYLTMEHIDLLNKGLQILKPPYYTIRELKHQRKFGVTKTHIKNKVKTARLEAEIEYKEYENRFSWNKVLRRERIRSDLIDHYIRTTPADTRIAEPQEVVLTRIEPKVQEEMLKFEETKKSLQAYIEEKIYQLNNQRSGNYTLQGDN